MAKCVVQVLVLVLFHLRGLSATAVEDLLSTQEAHEVAAHSDFVTWCHGAQSKLSDRITFQNEHIDELTGAIASYADKVGDLRSSAKNSSRQTLNALSQEQRIQLIQTESEHWRSVHAKEAAERLLEADKQFLEGVDASLQWEAKALSQHQAARKQLMDLVHEQKVQLPAEPLVPVLAQPPVEPVVPVAVPAAAAVPPPPAAVAVSPPPAAAVAEPRALPKVEVKASLRKPAPAPVPAVPHVLPQAKIERHTEKAVIQMAARSPVFGITQLPVLQLVQAEFAPPSLADEPNVPLPLSGGLGLFSALQAESHPLPPSPPAAAEAEPSATALLTPMLPRGEVTPLPSKVPLLNPLLSLAGMSSGSTAQEESAIAELASPQAPALAPTASAASQPSPKAQPAPPAPQAQELAAPVAAAVAAPVAAAIATPVVEPAAPIVPSAKPDVLAAVPVPVPVPRPAAKTELKEVKPHKVPAAAKAGLSSGESPHHSNPRPAAALADTAPKATKALAESSKPVAHKSPSASPGAPKTVDSAQDPEDALMAIMTGDDTDASPAAASVAIAAPTLAPQQPVAPPPKVVAAFLATKARHVQKVSAPTPAPSKPEDSEDALMEAMMQGTDDSAPPPPPVAKVTKHVPRVLAQTAQVVHTVTGSVKSHAKPIKAQPKKQVVPDADAGVMQSFIQEVSDLGQGETGSSQVDPAAPVLKANKEQKEKEVEESDANMMSSFVQEVSRLAQGESEPDAPVKTAPSSASGLALSSDLESLMGLTGQGDPASFLQVSSQDRHSRSSLSDLAAASLIKDLDASEVSKRLAETVSQSSAESNIQMLTALNLQLQEHHLQWSCGKGRAAAHSMAVLQLAETGTSLLAAERDTVTSLRAELRDAESESAQLRAEFVGFLEKALGRSYEAAVTDLEGLPLAQILPEGASAFAALENSLQSDAAAGKELASKWVDQGAEYVRLADELLQTSSAKDSELKKAQKVLSEARARAAASRAQVAKDSGCADAARTSELMAAVYKALHILSGRED